MIETCEQYVLNELAETKIALVEAVESYGQVCKEKSEIEDKYRRLVGAIMCTIDVDDSGVITFKPDNNYACNCLRELHNKFKALKN